MRADSNLFETSARDLVFILFKRKWSILAIVLVAMVSAVFWIWFIRGDVYVVSAKVLVRIGHEQASSPTVSTGLGGPIMITGERMQDVNSEVDILKSVDLLGRVVDQLGLDKAAPPEPLPAKFLPRLRHRIRVTSKAIRDWRDEQLIKLGLRERLSPREEVLDLIEKGFVVTAERNSNVITARLLLSRRQNAGAILNTLLDFYQTFRLQVYQDRTAGNFFRGEVDKASVSLREAEQELHAFEGTWDISTIEKQKEVLLSQAANLERDLMEAQIASEEASLKLRRLEAEVKSDEPNLASVGAFPPNSFSDKLLQQFAELQREREMLRMTELDTGLRIQHNRRQFKVLTGLLLANLRTALAEQRAVLETRKQALAACRANIQSLQARQMGWRTLNRKIKILEDNYLMYHKKLDETTAAAAMEQQRVGNVVVIAHAVDPLAPAGMRKTTLLGVALVVAILAALVWVAVAEFFDHRIYTVEALEERLGAPVLGVVPAVSSRWRLFRRSYAGGR